MKKKCIVLSVIFCLLLSLSACGQAQEAIDGMQQALEVAESLVEDASAAGEVIKENASVAGEKLQELKDKVEEVAPELSSDLESLLDESSNLLEDISSQVTQSTGTFAFDIPEDFVETSENYYSVADGSKLSNMNYLSLANDGSFDDINAAILLSSVEPQLESLYGIDLTLMLLEETFYDIEGNRAFRYGFEYDVNGYRVIQYQCIVETTDLLHFMTYTEYNNEGYLNTFLDSMNNLRFE